VIVISPDLATQTSHLQMVFYRLWAARLKLNLSKCALLQQEVKYLRHVISRNGIAMDPKNVQVVEEWTVPWDLQE